VSDPWPTLSAQPRGAAQARRWPLAAALVVVVALTHALALMGLVAVGGGAPAVAGQAVPARLAMMAVRTVQVPAPPVRDERPAAEALPAHPPTPQLAHTTASREPAPDSPLLSESPDAITPTVPTATPAAIDSVVTASAASPEPLVAAATTPPVPPAPAAPPLPRYRASLPPPFEARFDMRRGALRGQADWRFSTAAGGRYQLELQTIVLGQNLSHLRSEGGVGSAGLEPSRFVDGRRGRDRRAVNFQRDAPGGPRISFSGPAHELPLPEGVQDRLSWLLQLAAIVDSDPALRQPGARISMWVVSPRGDAEVWVFEIIGSERLRSDDGVSQPTLALQRRADRQLDTEVRVWLDPAAHHLPLRAVWRHDGEGPAVELQRLSFGWR
jgi:hypothetical protein